MADKIKLTIVEQFKLIHDKCPEAWEYLFYGGLSNRCPNTFGLSDDTGSARCFIRGEECIRCWSKAVERMK